MIEILYLFLCYLPLTIFSFLNYNIIFINNLYFTLIPIIYIFKNIVPYPFYYDLIALISNYLIILFQLIYYKNSKYSFLINISLRFLTNYFILFIFLGYQYIFRLDNIFDAIFGLVLLSISYLYYPFLHRFYFGNNKITWKRKIDYYYSYYKFNYQYYFIFDILEGLTLGILCILFYNDIKYKEIYYIIFGFIKMFYNYYRQINFSNNKYIYLQIILIIISLGLIVINKLFYSNDLMFLVNGILQTIINVIYIYYNSPHKYIFIIRQSISLPELSILELH